MLCYYGIGDRLSCHYKYIIFIVENMHMINEEEVNKLCHGFIKVRPETFFNLWREY